MNDSLPSSDLEALDALAPELLAPVAPPPELRAQILAAATGVPQNSVTLRAGDTAWRPFPLPGVRWQQLSSSAERGTQTLLVELAPAATLPAHGHEGSEDCFVVSGSCRIGSVVLAQGDFHHVEAGAQHGTVVSDEGCTLLLVLDARDWQVA